MTLDTESIKKLKQYEREGYISAKRHPNLPLTIYNYTPKTQFERKWDEITCACRGLVIDDDNNIVIKSPKKFFNYNEPEAPKIDFESSIITEKLDGYYIAIKLDSKYGLLVTSRGSFDNQYTQAAKTLVRGLRMAQNHTYFCELLQDFAGDEKIIVTKHPDPKLVCWAENAEDDTEIFFKNPVNPFKTASIFSISQMFSYLKADVEGVVIHNLTTGDRIKVKTEWYLERHRFISHCDIFTILEYLKNGQDISQLEVPDEMFNQVKNWQDQLTHTYSFIENTAKGLEKKYRWCTDKQLAWKENIPEMYKSLIFTIRKKPAQLNEQIWKSVKRVISK